MIRVEIPKDIRPFVLKLQDELKKKKSLKLYSQQLTIFHIIREYKKIVDLGGWKLTVTHAKGEVNDRINILSEQLGLTNENITKVIKSGLDKGRNNKKDDTPPADEPTNN